MGARIIRAQAFGTREGAIYDFAVWCGACEGMGSLAVAGACKSAQILRFAA
jgi:hypothetical protein